MRHPSFSHYDPSGRTSEVAPVEDWWNYSETGGVNDWDGAIYHSRSEIIINPDSSARLWFIPAVNTFWQKLKNSVVAVSECSDNRHTKSRRLISRVNGYREEGENYSCLVNFLRKSCRYLVSIMKCKKSARVTSKVSDLTMYSERIQGLRLIAISLNIIMTFVRSANYTGKFRMITLMTELASVSFQSSACTFLRRLKSASDPAREIWSLVYLPRTWEELIYYRGKKRGLLRAITLALRISKFIYLIIM